MPKSFVHLRMHSEFSVRDSIVRLDEVVVSATPDGKINKKHTCPPVEMAKANGMPALALSDTNNLFGLIKFYRSAKEAGVQPIPAIDLRVKREALDPSFRVLVLAQSREGYRQMCEMLTAAYVKNDAYNRGRKKSEHEEVYVDMEWLKIYNKDLIVLSGAMDGDVGIAIDEGRHDDALKFAEEWKRLFPGRYYVELQKYGRRGEIDYMAAAISLADKLDIPLVATHPIQFMKPDDYPYHEARFSIQSGKVVTNPSRPRIYNQDQYFKTSEEMVEAFSMVPDAIANTIEIAKRCHFDIELGKPQLPNFPVPEGMTAKEYMASLSRDRLTERLSALYPDEVKRSEAQQKYMDRLEFEIQTINQMGFEGYFLIVADFINWAKENNVPVGPGRGSGAGSLVAYCLGITDIDPLPYDLLFERFLNPERVSMPDFDVDFCENTRYKVIQYVSEKYGSASVSQIATYGTGAAKGVIRDAGRVLGFSYGLVDNLAKMIPNGPGVTLQDAADANPEIDAARMSDGDVDQIFQYAEHLEKIVRNVGKHAGGVLISPGKITDFCPLYAQGESGLVSQYDKDDVEAVGLVKFDFLGLKTLTTIQRAVDYIKDIHGVQLDPLFFDLTDNLVWDKMKASNTTAVFQVEGKGMKGLLSKMQPDNFEDLIALVALFRPGPLQSGMVDDFINRKHGKADVDYMTNLLDQVRESVADPGYAGDKRGWSDDKWKSWKAEQSVKIVSALEPILAPTYGVIVYQEQVMQIAQAISGYTLGGADMLRRAMGKKKPEEMAKQRSIFEEGAVKNNIDGEFAGKLFDLIAMFAEYGFNKSHSAAYAMITYQTAWLKKHYPTEFMAAAMTSEVSNTEQLKVYIDDARKNGLIVNGPDINKSEIGFTREAPGVIRYGLSAIKSVGDGAQETISEARKTGGPFVDIEDFLKRVNRRAVTKRVVERLVVSGAFDSVDQNRAKLLNGLPKIIEYLDNIEKAKIKAARPIKEKKEPKKTVKQMKAEAAALLPDIFGNVPAAPPPPPAPEPVLSVEERIKQAVDELPRPNFFDEDVKDWSLAELLDKEIESMGLHFSHHPFEVYAPNLQHFNGTPLGGLVASEVNLVTCGVISSIFKKLDKSGREMAFVQLDDGSDKQEVLFFHDSYAGHRNLVKLGAFMAAEVSVRKDEKYDRPSIIVQAAYNFQDAQTKFAKDGDFSYGGPLPSGVDNDVVFENLFKSAGAEEMTMNPDDEVFDQGDGDMSIFNP